MKIIYKGHIYEASKYIGNCVSVGNSNSNAPICKIFGDATEMAQKVYDPDENDLHDSTEISKEEFEKYIDHNSYPKKMLKGVLKYFYISEGIETINWVPHKVTYTPSQASIFYVYNEDQDIHYFFKHIP